MKLHQTKKSLCSKGNHPQNEKTANWMGEHICWWCPPDTSDKGLIFKIHKELTLFNTKKKPKFKNGPA